MERYSPRPLDGEVPGLGRIGARQAHILHLAGRVTDSVFSFLGPATTALANEGARQTVVLIDDPLHRHLLPKFHESVRLVLTEARESRWQEMSEQRDAFCSAARGLSPTAAHLHGFLPLMVGVFASVFRGFAAPMHFSPHGSRLLVLGRAMRRPVLRLSQLFGARLTPPIVNSRVDARSLGVMTERPVAVVESPVAEDFFSTALAPAPAPLIVTCSRLPNPLGAALFAQASVLLAGEVPGLLFGWIGDTDAESRARLQAAAVSVRDSSSDEARAARMAQAWVYLAPPGGHGFPAFLTEAMALGLACIAWDTPHHRDIIRDDDTGFLCRSTAEAIERIVELIESEALRLRLGANARREARVRFDGGHFRDSMLDLYGVVAPR